MTRPLNTRGAIAVAAGAAVWGLFWIPLRWIDDSGLDGLIVVAIANGAAALVLTGYLGATGRRSLLKSLQSSQARLVGATLGASSVLYMLALIYTDVIRAVFLFYLLPIWAALAARWLTAEPISLRQLSAIALTIAGVWLLLGGSAEQLQARPGFGDSLAIAAGMTWGLGLALLGGHKRLATSTSCLATFAGATAFALLAFGSVQLLPESWTNSIRISTHTTGSVTHSEAPENLKPAILSTILFGLFLLLPSVTSQVWGAERLPASTAAMLTTTEIVVATISSVWLIGTSVDASGALGAGLITLAILQTLRPGNNKDSARGN